jgi:hypothetical protein
VLGSSDQGIERRRLWEPKRAGESKSLVVNEGKNQKAEDFRGNEENRRELEAEENITQIYRYR